MDAAGHRQGRTPAPSINVALVVFVFFIYYITFLHSITSKELNDYPFSSDVAMYAFGDGAPEGHRLITLLMLNYRYLIFTFLGFPETSALVKLPCAIMGAANFAVVLAVFTHFFGGFGLRTALYSLCYAFSFMVWYFASVPESYALTTLLYSIYIYVLLRFGKDAITPRTAIALTIVFFAALYNDLSVLLLLIVPTIYFGFRLATEPDIRRCVILHTAAFTVYLLHNVAVDHFFWRYWLSFKINSPVDQGGGLTGYVYNHNIVDLITAFFLHGVGSPSVELPHATGRVPFPYYKGFFDPTLYNYFDDPTSLLFLVMFILLVAFIRVSKATRMIAALTGFVTIRLGFIALYNPAEAILYPILSMLALMLILFYFLEASSFRYKTAFAALLLTSIVATNAKFFLFADWPQQSSAFVDPGP